MENRVNALIATGVLMPILAIIFVGLRFKARRLRKNSLQWDDWLILIAIFPVIGMGVLNIIGAFKADFGTIGVKTTPERHVVLNKVIWIGQWISVLALGMTKISVLLFYRRIFVGRVFDISTYVLMALSVIWTIAFFFGNLLECIPVWGVWHPAGATCVNVLKLWRGMFTSDIILNILILIIPIWPVVNLKISRRQKFLVSGIFLLGAFVVIISAIKLHYLETALSAGSTNKNALYNEAPVFYWACIEASVGIISACLPMLKALVTDTGPGSFIQQLHRRLSDSILRRSSSASGDTTHGGVTTANKKESAIATVVDMAHPAGSYSVSSVTKGSQHNDFDSAPNGIVVSSAVTHEHDFIDHDTKMRKMEHMGV